MHKCKAPKISYLETKTLISEELINSEYHHIEAAFQYEDIKGEVHKSGKDQNRRTAPVHKAV